MGTFHYSAILIGDSTFCLQLRPKNFITYHLLKNLHVSRNIEIFAVRHFNVSDIISRQE